MTGLADLEATIAKLEDAAELARAETRELHSTIKAAKAAQRELLEAVHDIKKDVPLLVAEHMGLMISRGSETYTKALRDAMDLATERIDRALDERVNLVLYGNAAGKGVNVLDSIGEALRGGLNLMSTVNGELPTLKAPKLRDRAKP